MLASNSQVTCYLGIRACQAHSPVTNIQEGHWVPRSQEEAWASGKGVTPGYTWQGGHRRTIFLPLDSSSHVYTRAQGCGQAFQEPRFLSMRGRVACFRGQPHLHSPLLVAVR